MYLDGIHPTMAEVIAPLFVAPQLAAALDVADEDYFDPRGRCDDCDRRGVRNYQVGLERFLVCDRCAERDRLR